MGTGTSPDGTTDDNFKAKLYERFWMRHFVPLLRPSAVLGRAVCELSRN
jgi:hypothetical protein